MRVNVHLWPLCALLAACTIPITAASFVPSWPESFSAQYEEVTWHGNATQRHTNCSFLYDWSMTSQKISRPVSYLNPVCNGVAPGLDEQCVQHAVDTETLYIYFPTQGRCCIACNSGCGTLRPTWVTARPYAYGGLRNYGPDASAPCDVWTITSNTPDRVATRRGRPDVLCELYDGGADFTGDGPWQALFDLSTFSSTVDPTDLQLPPYCKGAAKC